MNGRLFGFVGLAALVGAAQAQGGFPIATDRPSFSDAASLVPKGRWQIETGSTFYRAGGDGYATLPEFLLRVPLSDRFELRLVNVNATQVEGGAGSGWQDPGVGFKYRLSRANRRPLGEPEVTLVGLLQFPAGTRGLRGERAQPTAKIAWYLPVGAADGFGGNLVVGDYSPPGGRFTQYAASLYWAHAFDARLASFAEVYGLAPLADAGDDGGFADAGLTYLLNKATQLDVRYGRGFDLGRDGWFVGAGVAFRF